MAQENGNRLDVALMARLMQLVGMPALALILWFVWGSLVKLNDQVNGLSIIVATNRGDIAKDLESVRQIQIDRTRRFEQIENRLDRMEQTFNQFIRERGLRDRTP